MSDVPQRPPIEQWLEDIKKDGEERGIYRGSEARLPLYTLALERAYDAVEHALSEVKRCPDHGCDNCYHLTSKVLKHVEHVTAEVSKRVRGDDE